jgi:hypothetical protein
VSTNIVTATGIPAGRRYDLPESQALARVRLSEQWQRGHRRIEAEARAKMLLMDRKITLARQRERASFVTDIHVHSHDSVTKGPARERLEPTEAIGKWRRSRE